MFQEVMKQWARMCHSFRCLPNGCSGCPLVHERCYHEMPCRMDISIIESKVMAWAAEHKEPVYPTWKEWLEEQRVVVHFDSVNEKGKKVKWELTNKSNCPIPADIAEKLGIEPKEG